MVASTRAKNKLAHPAAPVMTEAAKRKAGIKAKRRSNRGPTKDEKIRALEAKLDALENPHQGSFSKEPLFTKGSSPMPDAEDLPFAEPEIPTEIDSDDHVSNHGRKRAASTVLPNARALKRTKAYSAFEDVRPTLRNKPSGLRSDWHNTVSKSSVPHQLASTSHTRSTSSSMFSMSPSIPSSPPQEFDHMSSLLAISPSPVFSQVSSFPSRGGPVPLVDLTATGYHRHGDSPAPLTLPRAYKDEEGQKQQPGLKDLPPWLRENFRNQYIRRIIKQREFSHAYPTKRVRLHSDDAAVVPTLRDVGVLRNQIGSEALATVIEYLPSQYDKRMLNSKAARARYISTVLADPQRPFIWEYFRPGTIPLAGERKYYDEKRRGPFQSEPVLRAFSVYFTSHGIQGPIPSMDPGDGLRPIGALALAATAVERAYRMHLTGDYVSGSNDFSSSKWLAITDLYLEKIQEDLTSDNWTGIFQGLHRLASADEQDSKIEIGAPLVPRQREALLPADPPTPPPLD